MSGPEPRNEIGNVYGRLTVLKRVENGNCGQLRYLCRCECGVEKEILIQSLRNGGTKSCGCLQREVTSTLRRLPPGQAGFNQVYKDYKRHARERGLPFELTKEDFSFLTQMNCHYCGIEPKQESWASKSCIEAYIYNGIDRIDNTEGYTMDNVVACCGLCNWQKKDLTIAEFIEHAESIVNHRKGGNQIVHKP